MLPTRTETDFSVLGFAEYPKDEAYEEFVVCNRFASASSEPPASLRKLLAGCDSASTRHLDERLTR